jgi:hypothetical protein
MSLIAEKRLIVAEIDGITNLKFIDTNFDAYDCGHLEGINMYLKLQKDIVMANS